MTFIDGYVMNIGLWRASGSYQIDSLVHMVVPVRTFIIILSKIYA